MGYPRFSALLSAHSPFFICRQFRTIRSRLLLLKQDRISALEEQLNCIDASEKKRIYLGKGRCDKNTARIGILTELEDRISDYGTSIAIAFYCGILQGFDHFRRSVSLPHE